MTSSSEVGGDRSKKAPMMTRNKITRDKMTGDKMKVS